MIDALRRLSPALFEIHYVTDLTAYSNATPDVIAFNSVILQ